MALNGYPELEDVDHLGTVIGHPTADRIIAVSTSEVFDDRSLLQTFWGKDATEIDSGIQGHLYTRPRDVLVLRLPRTDETALAQVFTALNRNSEIWQSLTGLQLATSRSRLVFSRSGATRAVLPPNASWHTGTLSDAAAAQYQQGRGSVLAFVLNQATLQRLGVIDADLSSQAEMTSLLMDKNATMELLHAGQVPIAPTRRYTPRTWFEHGCRDLPDTGRYVFKPAGGAAGIGVFAPGPDGATSVAVRAHVHELSQTGHLPERFQLQQFIPGIPHGVSALVRSDGPAEILEIHRQVIRDGRCIGVRWTRTIEAAHREVAEDIYSRIRAMNTLHRAASGLLCLDLINGLVIEANPRLTASAPIAHLLSRENRIQSHRGSGFRITQIDVDSAVRVPFERMRNGTLAGLIDDLQADSGVLALPQGLNPFGPSRFVFVNDDSTGTAQAAFIRDCESSL